MISSENSNFLNFNKKYANCFFSGNNLKKLKTFPSQPFFNVDNITTNLQINYLNNNTKISENNTDDAKQHILTNFLSELFEVDFINLNKLPSNISLEKKIIKFFNEEEFPKTMQINSHFLNNKNKISEITTENIYNNVLIGKFLLENKENYINKKYFDIYYKKNSFNNIIDFVIKEVYFINSVNINTQLDNKEDFFSKMAHELKTPLNSIIGLINSIKITTSIFSKYDNKIESMIDSENFRENYNNSIITNNIIFNNNNNLKLIQSLSNYTIYLVNDLIQYFSNNSNIKQIKVSKDYVKLKKIINFCFDILKSLISCNEKKSDYVKPILIIEDNLKELEIYTDEIRINQILLNFISNAVKFTKCGNIQIIVELVDKEIIISIQDDGMGIKDEDKKYIFNPNINEEENNININYEHNKMGTGLGLSICYNIG